MYNVLDFPIRILAGEQNEGSHGTYPYSGEWESAAALGSPEAVHKADQDSTRVVQYYRFRVALTPEPSRIDYLAKPEILSEWLSFVIPVRWGFPSAPSLGSAVSADVSNRAPFGPTYNSAWNPRRKAELPFSLDRALRQILPFSKRSLQQKWGCRREARTALQVLAVDPVDFAEPPSHELDATVDLVVVLQSPAEFADLDAQGLSPAMGADV